MYSCSYEFFYAYKGVVYVPTMVIGGIMGHAVGLAVEYAV